ncbi:MAG: ribosome assembly RNA-binding protein YhbY [Clostridia bacterium]|nr:ribosome assembly RNA-binding protein YhbY [Clostridia bacterium]
MITSKQRAWLRREGHVLEPIFRIGKEGVTDAVLKALEEALEKRELIKIKILETALLDTKETCGEVADKLGAEPVQAIGSIFIIYRKAHEEKHRRIELPKK